MPGVHTVPYSSGGARVAITADGQCGWWGRRTLGEIAFVNETRDDMSLERTMKMLFECVIDSERNKRTNYQVP
jgi:hypothetical protein